MATFVVMADGTQIKIPSTTAAQWQAQGFKVIETLRVPASALSPGLPGDVTVTFRFADDRKTRTVKVNASDIEGLDLFEVSHEVTQADRAEIAEQRARRMFAVAHGFLSESSTRGRIPDLANRAWNGLAESERDGWVAKASVGDAG